MEAWHRRLLARLLHEMEAVVASGLTLRFERLPNDAVGWRGTVDVDGVAHYLQLVYPFDFPMRPLWVRESDLLGDIATDDKKTYHQMPDGSLCLYTGGGGSDGWSPDKTVVDVVERYRLFRRIANEGGHTDDHGFPRSDLPGHPMGWVCVMTPGQRTLLEAPGKWGWITVRHLTHRGALVATRVEWDDGTLPPARQDISRWKTAQPSSQEIRFPWVAFPRDRWVHQLGDVDAVDAVLTERLGAKVVSALGTDGAALFVSAEGPVTETLLLDRQRLQGTGERVLLRHQVEFYDLADQVFSRVDGAMNGREALSRWRLVHVGLGSLGGSVALHLARAGVSRFDLFDPDVIRPENVCRHVVGIGAAYVPKVHAVAMAIQDRNPTATVRPFPSSPLWDGGLASSLAFDECLADPDTVIVVTTADEDVERAVNALALRHGRPVIYASVMGEADYGRVHRVLPRETPCYECIVRQQRRHPGTFFRAPEPATPRQPAMAGYRQPGIPGLGIDVEQVALQAARLTLQTLSRLGAGQPDYPDAPGHHLVWSNRDAEGFDHALQVRWEPYERDPDCPACGGSVSEDLDHDTVHERLKSLEAELGAPERLTTYDVPVVKPSEPQT